MNLPEDKKRLFDRISNMMPELRAVNDFIYDNPEPGREEYKAASLLTGKLNQHGFSVETGVAGLPTAFDATLQGVAGGETVALVAEYDALADLGHGCGHNIIATAALAAGMALAGEMPKLRGCIKVIGTPAEDSTSDKIVMIERGVFDRVDFAMQCHPNDRTMTGAQFKALHKAEIRFFGQSSHASRAPEKGVSALDALLLTFTAIEYLREHVRRDAVMSGIITHGGTAPNSIPEFAAARFVFRSDDGDYLKEVVERAYNCARGAELATGARLEIVEGVWLDDMRCVPAFDRVLMDNARLLDPPQVLPQETAASTDFANVSTKLPSSRLEIAFVPPGTSTHSQEFVDAGKTDAAYGAIQIASFAMAATAYDLLTDPELASAIKKDHEAVSRQP